MRWEFHAFSRKPVHRRSVTELLPTNERDRRTVLRNERVLGNRRFCNEQPCGRRNRVKRVCGEKASCAGFFRNRYDKPFRKPEVCSRKPVKKLDSVPGIDAYGPDGGRTRAIRMPGTRVYFENSRHTRSSESVGLLFSRDVRGEHGVSSQLREPTRYTRETTAIDVPARVLN